jgi:chloride channel protein, CIC family
VIYKGMKTVPQPADVGYAHLHRTMIVSLLAVLVGIIAGFGAVGFRYLIGFFHNLFFSGRFSFFFNSEVPFVSSWGLLVIFVPAIGITIADFITRKWAPEAKGHGVPEVMASVMENRGKIRPVVCLVKSLASAITIGAGGSVGREGPIVQIGASFGSTLGQFLKLDSREVIILVGAGVAGGIGATFNAPIGGIMFALELILPEYSIMTIMPLVISSIIATQIAVLIIGSSPAFVLPMYQFVSSWELGFYLTLGLVTGLISVLFIHSLYSIEDLTDRIRLHPSLKAFIGGTLLGCIGILLYRIFGQYYVFGVGYAFLGDVLTNNTGHIFLLITLIVVKIAATDITLAAGGSGGIFAPSLFLGAAVGAALGLVVNLFFPGISATPSAYAIVGMASMVSGVTGASLTAIIMIFEMTRNYEIMLPLMLSVVVAHFTAALVYRETIYTKKLTRRGIMIQLDKRIPIFKTILVGDIMKTGLIYCEPSSTVASILEKMHQKSIGLLPVLEEGRVIGSVGYDQIYHAGLDEGSSIETIVERKPLSVQPGSDLYTALRRMRELKTNILVVVNETGVVGFITHNNIINSYLEKRSRL